MYVKVRRSRCFSVTFAVSIIISTVLAYIQTSASQHSPAHDVNQLQRDVEKFCVHPLATAKTK